MISELLLTVMRIECWQLMKTGTVVDGDGIISIIAKGMKDRGTLRDNKVCVTVMSNLGMDICRSSRY